MAVVLPTPSPPVMMFTGIRFAGGRDIMQQELWLDNEQSSRSFGVSQSSLTQDASQQGVQQLNQQQLH